MEGNRWLNNYLQGVSTCGTFSFLAYLSINYCSDYDEIPVPPFYVKSMFDP